MKYARLDDLDGSEANPAVVTTATAHEALVESAYRQYRDEICRYVRRAFGTGPPEPDDIVHSAFMKFAGVEDTGSIGNVRAFLFRTAHNLSVDARRKQGRGDAILADPAVVAIDGLDFSPEDVLVTKDELERLNQAIATLRPKERTALLMHRLDGLSYAEIARRMGVSPSGAARLVDHGFELCMRHMRRRQL